MKIFICASKHNYGHVAKIKKELENMGHIITVPNSYDEPMGTVSNRVLNSKNFRKFHIFL